MSGKDQFYCRVFGAAGGLLLAAGNLYPTLAFLQATAFVPIFYLSLSGKAHLKGMLLAGLYMGLGYILPQLVALRLPLLITVILLLYLTAVIIVLACGSAWLLRGSALWGSFAAGAFCVVVDWLNFTVLPMWGTAQSLVRCWSQYPNLIAFTSFTGMGGVIFLLGTLQAIAVNVFFHPKRRRGLLIATAAVVVVFLAVDAAVWLQKPAGKVKVAAIGWLFNDSDPESNVHTKEGFANLYAGPAAEAARAGAKLIVSGEMGFYISKPDRAEWLARFAGIAGEHNVFLVVGYFNVSEDRNRLFFMNPQGQILGEYTKTCLTPFEHYQKGDGKLQTIEAVGLSVGAMICQDDNFTRFSRQYGRKAVSIVAVPTLDWETVKDAHLQSSIHRAIESRYAIVRAAVNGVSTIISPKGKLLARRDHFTQGPGVIIAEVDIYRNRTLFSIAGNWLVVLSLVVVAIGIWRTKSRKTS